MARAPTSYNQCITAVETAAGRELSEADLDTIFTKTQGRIRRYQAEGLSEREAAMRAGKEIGEQMRLAALIEKRSELINLAVKQDLWKRLPEGKEAKALRGIMDATDAQAHGVTAIARGPMIEALRREGLMRPLAKADKTLDAAVARELWAVEDGKTSVTGNKVARRMAEILHEAQDNVRAMQNKAGAWISKLDHYITRQSHDMDKIRGDGTAKAFEQWADDIAPKLDEKTFDGLAEDTAATRREWLRDVWRALASGVHDTARGADMFEGFTGPGNLAKRLSAERKLHFKSADDWIAYNDAYGKGGVLTSVLHGLDAGARNTALLRTWGTNPEAMYGRVRDDALKAAVKREDFKASDALKGQWNDKVFDTLTGKANIAGNSTLGSIQSAVLTLQTLSKLGGVVLSSLPDLAVNAAALRHNGIGLFESYASELRGLLPKGSEGRAVADSLAVGIDGMLGGVASRLAGSDGIQGTAGRLTDLFHKANGLSWWTDSLKSASGMLLSHNLARNAGNAFDKLDPRLQATLRRYGIDAAGWDQVRATPLKAADGREYLLPAHIEDEALRIKFSTYIQDQVREGMTESTATTRTIATWGTQAGTPGGMAVRLLMQFKQYPITFMARTLNREFRSPDGMDIAGVAHLVVATSLLGYASMSLKDLAKGRTPRGSNADDSGEYAKVVFAAMAQGGGLGIYGDFLFGDTNRMGGGPVVSLFGPTAGTLDQLATEIQNLRKAVLEGDAQAGKDARSGALGLVRSSTPFINMFYSRAILDYMVFNRLQEAMNPGYLRRYEQRVQREQGQTFWLSPSASPF